MPGLGRGFDVSEAVPDVFGEFMNVAHASSSVEGAWRD